MAQRTTNTTLLETDATGILQCLQMLAEEAASLQLARTFAALRAAMEICASENPHACAKFASDEDPFTENDPIVLH